MNSFPMVFFMLFLSYSLDEPGPHVAYGTECEVVEFYEAVEPGMGTRVLTSFGQVEEAQLLLVPTRMDEGRYTVELTRKGDNLYQIEGTTIYIGTRFCLELALYDNAVLVVDSPFGLTKGSVTFE